MKPFLRWCGGKSRLIDDIRSWLPESYTRYHEAFLGSGALFFSITTSAAYLTDANTRLTRTFGAVQRDTEAVIAALKIYAAAYAQHGAPFYTHVREHLSDAMDSPELAAAFIFLNKTGFQGIYRVNRAGKYNVPPGKFATPPVVCDEDRIRACAQALALATIINSDFRATEERAQPGDACYFDPPYIPTSETADFTSYTKEGFGLQQQIALRDMAVRLKKKGVYVLLSNSDTPRTRELYQGFELREIQRTGSVNSDVEKRQKVSELLIR